MAVAQGSRPQGAGHTRWLHLPGTLKQVEKAVAKAHAEHEKVSSGRTRSRRVAGGVDEQLMAEAVDADALDDELGVDTRPHENLGEEVANAELEVGEVPM